MAAEGGGEGGEQGWYWSFFNLICDSLVVAVNCVPFYRIIKTAADKLRGNWSDAIIDRRDVFFVPLWQADEMFFFSLA